MTDIQEGYRLTYVDEDGQKREKMFRRREEAMLESLSLKEAVIDELKAPKLRVSGEIMPGISD